MAERKTQADPRRRWRLVLLLWAAVLLLIGLVGCALLYGYLAAYEVSRPEILMDQLMATMDREDFLAAAAENLDFRLTEFEDADALFQSYVESIPEGSLSYTSSKARTGRDSAVFVVRSGARSLCTVELVPGEQRYGFGRHDWVLGRVSSGEITEQLSSVTVKVDALPGQEVRINGVPIAESWISDDALPIPALSELEKRFDETPHLVEYTVAPLYGELVLTDGEGRELYPAEGSDEEVSLYDASPEGDFRLTITAPEGVKVTVGGAGLGRADVSSSSPGVLEGLERYLPEGGYDTYSYRFDGLYSRPEVTAADADGRSLTPIRVGEGRYAFYYENDEEAQEALQSVAENYFTNYLNYTLLPFDGTYFYNLLQKTLWSSDLYKYIFDSQQAMLWAAQTSPEIRTLRYGNFHRIGDSCFVCTVEYDIDMTAYTWDNELQSYRLQNAYELCFVRENNFWYAAAMEAVTE